MCILFYIIEFKALFTYFRDFNVLCVFLDKRTQYYMSNKNLKKKVSTLLMNMHNFEKAHSP